MSQLNEQILDQAVELLNQGYSLAEIYTHFPEHQNELLELLPMAQLLSSIPTNSIPAPIKHYRFAESKTIWQQLSQLFITYRPIAIPAFAVVFFLSGSVLAHAASKSLPGDTLFPLRVAGERTRLSLTFDEEKVANLHVEIAQNRLADAKKAIENSDPQQEKAAIEALTEQTEKTLAVVSQIATNKAITQKDTTLLDDLLNINKEQKTLLATATQSEQTKAQAETALDESKEADLSLAKIIATVNEQELIDLPNKISVTGIVPAITSDRVTLEKNTFTINEGTVLINTNGEVTNNPSDIHGKITVIGTRENNILLAKKIVVIDPDAILTTTQPIVKGVSTGNTTSNEPLEPTTAPTEPAQEPEAQAGFIAEPNNQIYAQ